MTATASVIPELEDVIRHGSRARRAETLRRITTLFLDGASRFAEEHVQLFDDVFGRLIEEIETKARAELAVSLAPLGNAPKQVLRTLASDDDISVAEPVLRQAVRLDDVALLDIASTKSQAHLLAICGRPAIGEEVTDVLVRRGDREVARHVAGNQGARLSELSFTTLVKRAENDGVLAERVGVRPDIPPRLFRELLMQATEVVQQRLLAAARPETQAEIRRVLTKVSDEIGADAAPRDYAAAQRTVLALHQAGRLDEAILADFAAACQYEETVVALSALCKVPLAVVDRLMEGDRPDPVLILCKAADFEWPTVQAIILARLDGKVIGSRDMGIVAANFERLSASTARRVVRFWQIRQETE
jgi:uncharacterized protein (DUF2336 family)